MAFKLGRTVNLRHDWNYAKNDIMMEILIEKFRDHDLNQQLKSTGSAYIVEHSIKKGFF